MTSEIHCPQCNSTQFTATKGTDDTIQMTCTACGHVFTPEDNQAPPGFKSGRSTEEQQILNDIRQKGKIHAIKNYRDRYNCSLKEAKDKIDAVAGTSGVQSGGGGCAGVFLLIIVVITTIICLL